VKSEGDLNRRQAASKKPTSAAQRFAAMDVRQRRPLNLQPRLDPPARAVPALVAGPARLRPCFVRPALAELSRTRRTGVNLRHSSGAAIPELPLPTDAEPCPKQFEEVKTRWEPCARLRPGASADISGCRTGPCARYRQKRGDWRGGSGAGVRGAVGCDVWPQQDATPSTSGRHSRRHGSAQQLFKLQQPLCVRHS